MVNSSFILSIVNNIYSNNINFRGKKRADWIASTLINRIMLYAQSIEKTHGN